MCDSHTGYSARCTKPVFTGIRHAGGLAKLDLSGADPDAIKQIDAHAYLEPLIADGQARAKVIAKGFTRPWEISAKPPQQFIEAVTPDLGHTEAIRIHILTTARTVYLHNADCDFSRRFNARTNSVLGSS